VITEERRKSAWIGSSVIVTGNVNCTEDLVIDGQVHGTIGLGDRNLTIGSSATVVADLEAQTVIVSGTVRGSVTGMKKVELKSTAKVEGDITAPKFVMEDGAALSGKVDTGSRKA
jgi:cytoskeletal protein CcmA (bactofilin family)